jgi:hypothetical protein
MAKRISRKKKVKSTADSGSHKGRVVVAAVGAAAAAAAGIAAVRAFRGRSKAEPRNFYVRPGEAGWTVTVDGAEREEVLATHPNKKTALRDARERAHAEEPSRLVIHRADGSVERRHLYGEHPDAP